MNKLVVTLLTALFFMSLLIGAQDVQAQQKGKDAKEGKAVQPMKAQERRLKVAYITRLQHRDREIDDRVKNHLDSMGFEVTLIDQTEPAARANGADLLVISSTVTSQDLEHKYTHIGIPLLTWENDLLDDLRFTGRHKGVDFGEVDGEHYIWIVNAPHPLAAGLPAGINSVYRKDQPMGWGKPGLGAAIIATMPGQPEKAIIFGYEKGATMDYDFIAPARRVMLFLDNRTFPDLKPNGKKLFDAAINWAVGR
ncbi:hypothetical protein ACL9RF_03670 [Sphingobacterium sp. Mn56C]|uniref:hypothetical protein n=1 Tax=Sphingobacterium sp. Mn56C TaxID=3395261 RepID=UPI003BD31FD7